MQGLRLGPRPSASLPPAAEADSFRQGVSEISAISHVVVHTVHRGNIVRLGQDIAQNLQRGRKRHAIFEQKAERADNPRGTSVAHRPEIPGSLAIAATIRARHSRLRNTSQAPTTKNKHIPRNRSTLARSQIEAATITAAPELRRPPRSLNTGSNCGTKTSEKTKE